ncbi:MAG: MASE1 domain-containing protein, partial [Vulcanimicrobiaceae bacterium]
ALTAAGLALGNTAGPMVAAVLLRRLNVDARLERVRDVLLVAAIGTSAMFVTATNGVLWLVAAGAVSWPAFGSAWHLWWIGDAMGVLLFTPLVLTWGVKRAPDSTPFTRAAEILAFLATAIFVGWLGFMNNLRLGFLVFPVIVWASLRFSQRITTAAVLIITAAAITGAANARGPFVFGTPDDRLAYAMTVMAVLSMTGLIIAAMTAERENAEELRRAAERRELEHATEVARILQAAFLPKRFPERPDLTFDAVYLTAENKELIGGDWYDAFAIPDCQVVVSVGDIMCHGVGAAVIAAEIRQRILATAFTTSDPGEILTKVNATLGDHSQMLATALIAFIDPVAKHIR